MDVLVLRIYELVSCWINLIEAIDWKIILGLLFFSDFLGF
jgi:hypothetical protein